MRIIGEWKLRDDGVMRSVISVKVRGNNKHVVSAYFLIDTGADRTVFSASLFVRLGLPTQNTQPDFALSGIGGASEFVLVSTVIGFVRDDGGAARVRGEFAGFTDPTATDLSILGRDVLDNFDLIISRRCNEVLLIAPKHRYRIESD